MEDKKMWQWSYIHIKSWSIIILGLYLMQIWSEFCLCFVSNLSPLQYIPVPRAESQPVALPGLFEYRRLPARSQQPALPLPTVHPTGPRRHRGIPQHQRGQQHWKPASRHDALRHWKLTEWVQLIFLCVGVGVCTGSALRCVLAHWSTNLHLSSVTWSRP